MFVIDDKQTEMYVKTQTNKKGEVTMEKPVFDHYSSEKNGELIFVWRNPPGLDVELTYNQLSDLADALKIEALKSTKKREVKRK